MFKMFPSKQMKSLGKAGSILFDLVFVHFSPWPFCVIEIGQAVGLANYLIVRTMLHKSR